MRIGINEVLLSSRASGSQKRELNVLPELLRQIGDRGGASRVYFSRGLADDFIGRLTGSAAEAVAVKTPLPSLPTYQRILKGIPYWRRQVKRDKIDLFHTSYYPLPRLPLPTVLTVNDVRFLHLPKTYQRSRYIFLRLIVPASVRRASRIIAISQNTKADLVKLLGLPEEKIDVAPLAVSPEFHPITDPARLNEVRRRYELPDHFILFVGHLEPRKNLRRLAQAYLRVRNQTECRLVIVGKPVGFKPSLLDEIRQEVSGKDILYTGFVEDEDLPAVYTLASLLAFPSLHEGFGMPVLEAMACGTPVLTSNLSALPEIAGDAAVLIDPYDVPSIAAGMARLLKDEDWRHELRAKGLKRVQDFQPREIASKIIESYRKTLAQSQL